MRKKTTITKIIPGIIIFAFVISLFQFTLPVQAANTSMSSLYSNPNQGGSTNPYKFKVSDVVNSNILTSVVGCTGVVNKVATWMSKLLISPKSKAKMAAEKIALARSQLESACLSTKAGAEAGGDSIPIIGGISKAIGTIFSKIQINVDSLLKTAGNTSTGLVSSNAGKSGEQICLDQVKAISPEQLDMMIEEAEKEDQVILKEQCFDGIAIALAKNQLTAMTRSMMNWVNSGYGGNPFFVQNMNRFINKIERNVLDTGIDVLLAPDVESPYARDFARSTIISRGVISNSSRFLGGLRSDLEYFVTDPQSYSNVTDDQIYQAQRNSRTAVQIARDANNSFGNNFSNGGWNAWLALTQRDQNNPLGYTMRASQYLADIQAEQVSSVQNELAQNDGFLSQKTCISWYTIDIETGDWEWESVTDETGTYERQVTTDRPTDEEFNDPNGCAEFKVITPGTLIADKTKGYLESPDRQLELVKTINDGLNFLFSNLIFMLEKNGLSGLSDSITNTPINWTDSSNESRDRTTADGNSTYDNNGAYDGFNITRDLGNIYLRVTPISLGNWNAKTNLPLLDPKVAPEYTMNGNTITSNLYYTVDVPGETKLILDGYNYWIKGDRAFWDGKAWQNWKLGQANPVKKRGVIQIQQDYIVAAKEILKVLPSVMTNLGKLDYCIPGPNPSYKTNSTEAQKAYQDWTGSMFVGPRDEFRTEWKIDRIGSRTYKNLANIFSDNPNAWYAMLTSDAMWLLHFGPGYHYKAENNPSERNDIDNKEAVMKDNLEYVNSSLFQNFYEVFDKMMNEIYYKKMKNMYLENEKNPTLEKNPNYISMAQNGLDITKDMFYYNNEINKSIQDYTDAMNQAKINISKLEPIKTAVGKIIKDAQERRATNMIAILNAEAKRNGTPVLTEEQYYAKYANCLDEENIEFFDVEDIMNTINIGEKGRCENGFDDDLDGLIDTKDPDCDGYTAPTVETGQTVKTYYYYLSPCPATVSGTQTFQTSQTYDTAVTSAVTYNKTYAYGDVLRDDNVGNYYIVKSGARTSLDATIPSLNNVKTVPVINPVTGLITNGNCPVGAAQLCPAGMTGTYPTCTDTTGSGVCPIGWTGTYPTCVAPANSGTSGTGLLPPSSTNDVAIIATTGGVVSTSSASGTTISTTSGLGGTIYTPVTQTAGIGSNASFKADPDSGKTVSFETDCKTITLNSLQVIQQTYPPDWYQVGPITSKCNVWVTFN